MRMPAPSPLKPIGVNAAAMGKARESDQSALNYFARTPATQLGDEPHPAGIVVHFRLWGGNTAC